MLSRCANTRVTEAFSTPSHGLNPVFADGATQTSDVWAIALCVVRFGSDSKRCVYVIWSGRYLLLTLCFGFGLGDLDASGDSGEASLLDADKGLNDINGWQPGLGLHVVSLLEGDLPGFLGHHQI
jgi:hypothetical protein